MSWRAFFCLTWTCVAFFLLCFYVFVGQSFQIKFDQEKKFRSYSGRKKQRVSGWRVCKLNIIYCIQHSKEVSNFRKHPSINTWIILKVHKVFSTHQSCVHHLLALVSTVCNICNQDWFVVLILGRDSIWDSVSFVFVASIQSYARPWLRTQSSSSYPTSRTGAAKNIPCSQTVEIHSKKSKKSSHRIPRYSHIFLLHRIVRGRI